MVAAPTMTMSLTNPNPSPNQDHVPNYNACRSFPASAHSTQTSADGSRWQIALMRASKACGPWSFQRQLGVKVGSVSALGFEFGFGSAAQGLARCMWGGTVSKACGVCGWSGFYIGGM